MTTSILPDPWAFLVVMVGVGILAGAVKLFLDDEDER